MGNNIKKYNKKYDYSYTFGAFPTIELLKNKINQVIEIVISSKFSNDEVKDYIFSVCEEKNIRIRENDNLINKINPKGNCFVIGVFRKYEENLNMNESHVVLVNPSDFGNVGTIIRTSVGFGIKNIAIIEPSIDIYNPKVIRSSMGAIFKQNVKRFKSFHEYYKSFSNHDMFLFMLDGTLEIEEVDRKSEKPYSLVFGNEASGLDSKLREYGNSVFISHNNGIDSLNLAIAAAISMYKFSQNT
ncbi:TrmH family RNA methyltransferase [Oceanirhabdus seepicola]|uniref:TrmH family RNA methyltransferase n=1 Tax=Oceanirhabdus seepicola TaxID=2828781 RepID=A0A9J6P2K3_9CLOT|nr:TrmH family RNA methyltransferase [Oceanirhabdus seepicola]MCM1990133.1 TrmH family RNA methyltransferase [Oceanirhabdus seepicola]